MKRSIAIFIGHVGDAFQKFHAETLDVVHVNLLYHMGIGVFGRRDLHSFFTSATPSSSKSSSDKPEMNLV
jgi:hypothetical protein